MRNAKEIRQPIAEQSNLLLRFKRNRDGASAIEFAIVLPLFLVFIFAVLSYGMYFGAAHSTAQLAADAARAAVAGLDDTERESIAKTRVANTAGNYPLLTASKVSVKTAAGGADPNSFEVDVTFDSSALPIWAFANLIPLPSKQIQRTAVIRRGGY